MLHRVLMMLVGVLAVGVLGAPVALAEEGCPNEAVREAESAVHPEGFATALPDCRAYEQVTPVDKNGANATGNPSQVQASPSGDGIVFMTLTDMPGASGGDFTPFFLGSRGGEGWSDQGLQALRGPQARSWLWGWSEDLSEAFVSVSSGVPDVDDTFELRAGTTGVFQSAFLSTAPVAISVEVRGVHFSADDSRMIFETKVQLLPAAAAGEYNVYEAHEGILSLVGVLPDGSTPPGGSSAGPELSGEADDYTESVFSRDGSRVFFTADGTEQIYVRENGTRTVALGTGMFMAATPDGSKVFYLAGGDLFEFDVESEQTTDLTPAGNVQGLLGVSDDGSYVYYAAHGGEVYVWHDGAASFIATSSNSDNWTARALNDVEAPAPKVSRATPDGRFLLFTGSNGQLERFDATHGRLMCVSCALNGSSPVDRATLSSIESGQLGRIYSSPILVRNLSSDGSRVFFETAAALLPRDTNGVQDVYEWEQQGVSDCEASSETFSSASGGCLYLISSGTSPQPSYFADASASGDDVFFFTFQPLVGQDQDGLVDIYDARVGGGLMAQNPPPAAAVCAGEGCRQAAGGTPVFGAPVSTTFTGAGNQMPPTAVVAPKPKPKVRHKTVKPKRKRKRGVRKANRGGRGARVRRAMKEGK